MISFNLKCACGHRFESWFQSNAAFDKLKAAGMATCPACGGAKVEKLLMAPRVATSRMKSRPQPDQPDTTPETPATPAPASTQQSLTAPAESDVAQAMDKLRRTIEANTEDVGDNFAAEARRIHDGDAPERAIRGGATTEDAKKLIKDGIPVMPLPFRDPKKTN